MTPVLNQYTVFKPRYPVLFWRFLSCFWRGPKRTNALPAKPSNGQSSTTEPGRRAARDMLVERRGSSAKAPKRWRGESTAEAVRKAARDADGTTTETEEDEADGESEDEYVEPAADRGRKRKKPARAAVSEEDEDEETVAHASAAELSRADAAIESEMGIIEEIYCENFMCHRRMRVTLVRALQAVDGCRGVQKGTRVGADGGLSAGPDVNCCSVRTSTSSRVRTAAARAPSSQRFR